MNNFQNYGSQYSFSNPNSFNYGSAGQSFGDGFDISKLIQTNPQFGMQGLSEGFGNLGSYGNTGGGFNLGSLQTGLGAIGQLAGLFMGMQQYGLQKDALKFQKDTFNKNWAAQSQLTNSRLEDRQRARVASNPGGNYEDVASYMNRYGVK